MTKVTRKPSVISITERPEKGGGALASRFHWRYNAIIMRVKKLVVAFALAVYLASPVFEAGDRWDQFQRGSGDIAISFQGLATVVAAGVWFVLAARRRLRETGRGRAASWLRYSLSPPFSRRELLVLPEAFHDPPPLLLRI